MCVCLTSMSLVCSVNSSVPQRADSLLNHADDYYPDRVLSVSSRAERPGLNSFSLTDCSPVACEQNMIGMNWTLQTSSTNTNWLTLDKTHLQRKVCVRQTALSLINKHIKSACFSPQSLQFAVRIHLCSKEHLNHWILQIVVTQVQLLYSRGIWGKNESQGWTAFLCEMASLEPEWKYDSN